eukprot:XP_025001239.1 ERAD-associated E3 ubiquitin-protein ligase HRD1 isoform X2 [Gallus gallus]
MLFAPLWPYNPITPPPLLPHSPIFPPHSRPHFGVLWPSQPSFLPTAPPPPFLCAAGDGGPTWTLISWLRSSSSPSANAFTAWLTAAWALWRGELTSPGSSISSSSHSILLAAVLTTISRYVLHLLEPHCGALQENRDSCALCFSFCSGLIRALLYVGFIVSMIGTRTFPLFAAQSACLAVTQFKKAAVDLFVLCFADPSGNTLLPGATPEALPAEDNACVICREEMGPEVTALPCCHVFHTSCLRSWFRQQWTCPMCRMPVQRVFYPELMPPDPPAQPPDPPARPQTPPRTSPAPEPQNWDSYEEEEEEEEQRQPLGRTLNQEMIWVYQERFTRLEDENMAAWLLRCYDSGAKGVNLEGRQLRRLGSLSNEPALDRLICRREDSSFTLWKRMLSAVRQRYRNRKYVTPRASPWFTLDEGIQRLRQLAVVEMLYADSFDPDDPRADDCPDTTKCTPQMWWQLAVSAPSDLVATMTAVQCMYHNPASVMMLTCALQDYDRNVASIQRRCVTLLEELAREVQKLSREVEQLTGKWCGPAGSEVSGCEGLPVKEERP